MLQRLILSTTVMFIFQSNIFAKPAEANPKIDDVVIESITFVTFKDSKKLPALQIYLETKETISISCGDSVVEFLIDPAIPFYSMGLFSRDKEGKLLFKFKSKGDKRLISGYLKELKREHRCAHVT